MTDMAWVHGDLKKNIRRYGEEGQDVFEEDIDIVSRPKKKNS